MIASTQTDISLFDDQLEFDDYIHMIDKPDVGMDESRCRTSDGDATPTPYHVPDCSSQPSTSGYDGKNILKARSRTDPCPEGHAQTCHIDTSDTEDNLTSCESTFPVELVVNKTRNVKCTIAFKSNIDLQIKKLLRDKVKLQIVPSSPKTIYKPSNEDKSDSIPRKVSFSSNLTDVRILEDTEHNRILDEIENDILVAESVDNNSEEENDDHQIVFSDIDNIEMEFSDEALNCENLSSSSPEMLDPCTDEREHFSSEDSVPATPDKNHNY